MSLQSMRSGSKRRRSQPSRAVKRVNEFQYGSWRIEIDRRILGSTVTRPQFSATIRCAIPYRREFLSGFASKDAAKTAAEARCDEMDEESRPRWRPAGSHLKSRKN